MTRKNVFSTFKGGGYIGQKATPILANEAAEITPLYPVGIEQNEEVPPLYPAGIEEEKPSSALTEEQLSKLQDETDAEGILLPTEFNIIRKRKYADDNKDEIAPLLPTNL